MVLICMFSNKFYLSVLASRFEKLIMLLCCYTSSQADAACRTVWKRFRFKLFLCHFSNSLLWGEGGALLNRWQVNEDPVAVDRCWCALVCKAAVWLREEGAHDRVSVSALFKVVHVVDSLLIEAAAVADVTNQVCAVDGRLGIKFIIDKFNEFLVLLVRVGKKDLWVAVIIVERLVIEVLKVDKWRGSHVKEGLLDCTDWLLLNAAWKSARQLKWIFVALLLSTVDFYLHVVEFMELKSSLEIGVNVHFKLFWLLVVCFCLRLCCKLI